MHPNTALCDRFDELGVHERKNVVATLRELQTTLRDACAGYEVASRAVKDPALAALLMECASERRAGADDLESLLAALGDTTRDLPSVRGELHRGWIALRAAVFHGEPAGIVTECERGENVALARYERALSQKLPMAIANVLLDQAEAIRRARGAFERMRHPW